ncbi:MAG: Lsr2 family protein [Nocardioidaceae bacterium]|nr:Lsr2 family protein [Nocardioidaceae bacterium]
MAQRSMITYVSDLSGDEITDTSQPTVTFSLDGREFTIDLTVQEQKSLRDALEPYVGVAKPAARSSQRSVSRGRAADNAQKIRAWAREKGHQVSERGRIQKEIKNLYYDSMGQ